MLQNHTNLLSRDLISSNLHPIFSRANFQDFHQHYNSLKSDKPNTQNLQNIKNQLSYTCPRSIENTSFIPYQLHHPRLIAPVPQYRHRDQIDSSFQVTTLHTKPAHQSPLSNSVEHESPHKKSRWNDPK